MYLYITLFLYKSIYLFKIITHLSSACLVIFCIVYLKEINVKCC